METRAMRLLRKMRFSMATIMMLVVTAAAASALFARVREHTPAATQPYLRIDAPILFTLSILLTAVALGALKSHTAFQTMLQTTIACVGYLTLIWLAERGLERPLLYWFQVSFGLLVTLPLLARRIVKSEMPRGERRDWWKRTFEAVFFSFLTMMLVLMGLLLQWIVAMLSMQVIKF
jgi:hypothetical protein